MSRKEGENPSRRKRAECERSRATANRRRRNAAGAFNGRGQWSSALLHKIKHPRHKGR